MSYYEQIERAEQIIRDAETGEYDQALGIAPEVRAAIDAVRDEKPIQPDALRLLVEHDPDLADRAVAAGLVTHPHDDTDRMEL